MNFIAKDRNDMTDRTFIGVLLVCMGTLASGIGSHLIRRGNEKRSIPWVLIGNICVVFIGSGTEVAAFNFAAESLLAPLGGLVVLWSVLLNPCFGKPTASFAGTFLVIVGCGVVVVSGPGYHDIQVLTPLLFGVIFLGCFYVVFAFLIYESRGPMVDAMVAGSVAGFSNTMSKAMVQATREQHRATFSLFFFALSFALAQIILYNRALERHAVIKVTPTYMVSLMTSVCVMGGITFSEFQNYTPLHVVAFVAGVLLSCIGTWRLAQDEATAPVIIDEGV